MTASSHWRGWPIYWDGRYWRYKDTDDCVRAVDRPCGLCGQDNTPEGHDPCLGTLPGVANACCGHGHGAEAYVQFDNGQDVRGFDALPVIERLKECGKV